MATAADGTHPTVIHSCYRPQTKVICLQACVCPQRGGGGGVHGPSGVHGARGCMVPGSAWFRGECMVPGGAWWRPSPTATAGGRYASYLKAFLFGIIFAKSYMKKMY